MNITRENAVNDLMATIKIEMVKSDYDSHVDKALRNYQRQAKMPGFRPGKVPFGLINKMYRPSVLVEEVNRLVSSTLSNYLEENKLRILGSPMTNIEKQQQIDFDTQENFDFYFDVAIEPEFDVVLDDSITVNKYEINIEDDMVAKYVEDFRNRMGSDIEPETIEDKDSIDGIFIQLDADGNPLENGIVHSAKLHLHRIATDENRQKFFGLKVGDNIVFNPIEYFINEYDVATALNIDAAIARNMKSQFSYTIEKITRRIPAEITEDFFDKVFPGKNIHSMAEFEDKIRQDARISFSAETDKKFMTDCIEALVAKYSFPLAEDFLKRWILSNQKEDDKNKVTAEDLDKNFEAKYAKSIRWQVIENLIIAQQQINVTREDVRNHLISLFMGQIGADVADPEEAKRAGKFVDEFMNSEKSMQQVKSVFDHLLEKRLTDLFNSKFKIEAKPIGYMDFIKVLYPAPEQPAQPEEKTAEE